MAVKLFERYGHFCAKYALEVIVCFLTMVVGAITLNVSSPYELCHWATNCVHQSENEVSSDIVLLTVLRCGTIIYVYMQLKKIWKIGSVMIVGIVCAYAVFAVMTFSITVVHFLRKDMVIVSSALPVFLLLVDISRMVIFTQHCLSVKSIDLLQEYVAEAMGALMPVLTVDTLIELLLLINIGGYVQIRQLQQLSCFACLSVIINYIVFTTFVPACLSVYLTASNKSPTDDDHYTTTPSWHDVRFSKVLQTEQGRSRKIFTSTLKGILCFSLLILHGFRASVLNMQVTENARKLQNSFDSIFTLTPEQLFTVILIIILSSKYLFDDGYEIVTKLRRRSEATTDLKYNNIDLNNATNTVRAADNAYVCDADTSSSDSSFTSPRTLEECMNLLKIGSDLLTDAEIITLVRARKLPTYKLESVLQDANRGVSIRRQIVSNDLTDIKVKDAIHHIPHVGYDFTCATKACCENTVGYIPVPVGIVGPLLLDGQEHMVPMATTEGTLLASTNRGLKALFLSGGVKACVYGDGMSRAPVVQFPTVEKCCQMSLWLQDSYNFALVKEKFDETSRFARLKKIIPVVSGRLLFIRFVAQTGDAMGMNMVSKGAENALRWLHQPFPDMEVISISGNFCTDKKPSAVNWIEGRGKSVVCEAILPADVVRNVLKTDVTALVHLSHCKNHIGSAMSGSIGGFNAHAANVVTAIFIATGQDPAQNVVSSNCITTLEAIPSRSSDGDAYQCPALLITCTMPSLEVATIGGGSALEPQKACLNILGVAGSSSQHKAGENACKLAKIICATVVAGELSLLSALSTGDLVQSHMKHNRLSKSIAKQEIDHSIL